MYVSSNYNSYGIVEFLFLNSKNPLIYNYYKKSKTRKKIEPDRGNILYLCYH